MCYLRLCEQVNRAVESSIEQLKFDTVDLTELFSGSSACLSPWKIDNFVVKNSFKGYIYTQTYLHVCLVVSTVGEHVLFLTDDEKHK